MKVRTIVPYVFLAAASVFSLWRVELAVDESHESLCAALVDNRGILLDLIEVQAPPRIPEGADPALVEAIEQAAERSAEFKAYALRRLEVPPECVH